MINVAVGPEREKEAMGSFTEIIIRFRSDISWNGDAQTIVWLKFMSLIFYEYVLCDIIFFFESRTIVKWKDGEMVKVMLANLFG